MKKLLAYCLGLLTILGLASMLPEKFDAGTIGVVAGMLLTFVGGDREAKRYEAMIEKVRVANPPAAKT